MYTRETLEALARSRRAVEHLLQGQADDLIAAWLHALREAKKELDKALSMGDLDRAARLEVSRRVIAEQILEAARATNQTLAPGARLAVENAASSQEELIASQLPRALDVNFRRPDPEALKAIVERTTKQITVRTYYLSREAVAAMTRALRLGISGGLNPREAARRMVADTEGIFNGGIARALVIARTEMLDAHRAAARAVDLANRDILAGWQWYAKLDSRTCPSCIAQHGSLHEVDEPGPLDHHQGRCTRLPKTKTWRELGFDIAEPSGLDFESGPDWFNRQPEETQRDILGPKRYEAWRAGGYPFSEWSKPRTSDGWRTAYHTGKVGQPPEGGWRWPSPPPDRPLTPLERAHFQRRQGALPFDFHGETLTPREVEFAERMDNRGETIEWIPKPVARAGAPRPSSNDFAWRAKPRELKSTTAAYAPIKGHIKQAALRARAHGVVKEHFVIDLGASKLPAKVRAQLAKYNQRVKGATIKSLWVLSENGSVLEEIHLL